MSDLRERFEAKVSPEPMSGCLLWTSSLAPNGYGLFWVDGKYRGAHRVAFELAGGLIPVGMSLDHACHTKACVNPAHLRLATARQNACNLQGKNEGKFHSQFPGVSKQRWTISSGGVREHWCVQALLNGRVKRIGVSSDEPEAGAMYRDAMDLVETMSQSQVLNP